jgi:hypothetical protein
MEIHEIGSWNPFLTDAYQTMTPRNPLSTAEAASNDMSPALMPPGAPRMMALLGARQVTPRGRF